MIRGMKVGATPSSPRNKVGLLGAFLAALLFVLPGRAEWLYWTVDFSDTGSVASPWTDPTTTPQVWLVASKDPGTSAGGTVLADVSGGMSVALNGGQTIGGLNATDLAGYESAAYTFFIEMGAIAGQADYRSTGVSYTDLATQGFVKSGWTAQDGFWNASLAPWSPAQGVPEPTSGLLVAIGGSLLALRRRKVGATPSSPRNKVGASSVWGDGASPLRWEAAGAFGCGATGRRPYGGRRWTLSVVGRRGVAPTVGGGGRFRLWGDGASPLRWIAVAPLT